MTADQDEQMLEMRLTDPDAKGNAGSGPQGKYVYGETEDYYCTPDTSYTVCQDSNGDGVIDTHDLVDFTGEWSENCPEQAATSVELPIRAASK